MKVNGIIAEYNPFHNGHSYQLKDARRGTDADYTVIAMSGNFMQRGAPALLNKYKRTEMALCGGADLVLELPSHYAVSSAEYFATGAVSLLDKLGVVNHLCFGSECGELPILEKIASILIEEPSAYALALQQHLCNGYSYPAARAEALMTYDASLRCHKELFASPNNILGIEYMKALLRRDSSMLPFTTQRKGAGYHDKEINEKQCSALAIRQACFSGEELSQLKNQMPQAAYEIMTDCFQRMEPVNSNDFSAILYYKLLSEQEQGFSQYLDVSPELSDRICKHLEHFDSFQDFCTQLKSKDMTHTRISRCLFHILLDLKTTDMEQAISMDYVPYARVLGFRRDAAPLLSAIKANASIPLLTKLADAGQLLSEDAHRMLKQEIRCSSIYESTVSLKSGLPLQNEYRTPIVII